MSDDELRSASQDLWMMLQETFSRTRRIDEDAYAFSIATGPFELDCFCEIGIEERGYMVSCILPILIDCERRGVVGEYLHRVNYPLVVGGWAINPDDGQVRWRMGFYFGDAMLTRGLMFEAIRWSLDSVRRHILGLVKVSIGRSLHEALGSVDEDPDHGNSLLTEWRALHDHGVVEMAPESEA